jgi:hypothetical protein
MPALESKEEVTTHMNKARLILLLVFAVLLAVLAAKGYVPFGMNDGPWID